MHIQDMIQNIPGLCAIKDIDSRYIAISNDALGKLFGAKSFRNDIMDSDIPGTVSKLSNDFILSDQDVMKHNKTIRALNFGSWSKNFSGMILCEKKPYHLNGKLIGVSFNSTPLDSTVIKSLRSIINFDLIKKINHSMNCSLTINQKYHKLSYNAQRTLFFLLFGLSNQAMATHLNVSQRTVEHYITELKVVFNSSKKSEIIENAISQGFAFDIPDSVLSTPQSIVLHSI